MKAEHVDPARLVPRPGRMVGWVVDHLGAVLGAYPVLTLGVLLAAVAGYFLYAWVRAVRAVN